MIRTIRFLGAALGGLIGITLVIAQLAVFQPAPGSAVLVVRALPPAAAATYAELGSDLDSALSRLGAAAGTAVPSGTLR